MDETIKIQFICEACTTRLIIDCDESIWTFKHYCEQCRTDRTFLRDMMICDSPSYPSSPSQPDSLYLFRAGDHYKIGISKDPKRRLCDLSISPIPVELIWSSQIEDARGLERQLHKTFQGKRVHGEWFELTEADIEYIMYTSCNRRKGVHDNPG